MYVKRMALIAVLVCIAVGAVFAAVPPIINYQGKLMQPSGVPVPDGTYSMVFAIYAQPTGGTALWSETNLSVQVKGGLFATLLGSINNLPANIFDNPDRWFGVKVGADPEMVPRQQIASVPYAQTAGNGTPAGGIIMWSGSVASIPAGWALCDGTNGTPNLQDKFIVGAGAEYAVGATGGEKLHQLTVLEMPSHTHIQDAHNHTQDPHNHTWNGGFYQKIHIMPNANYSGVGMNPASWDGGTALTMDTAQPAIQNSAAINQNTGGDQPHENRPPYYALCFIMKLGY